jgi:hypothetical protein
MRDSTKVTIGFGCIWGLFALGGTLLNSFTLGINDTLPEVVALVLYGLTILPCCVLAIWRQKFAGWWLIFVSVATLIGFAYQIVSKNLHDPLGGLIRVSAWVAVLATIPALLGFLLLRSTPSVAVK